MYHCIPCSNLASWISLLKMQPPQNAASSEKINFLGPTLEEFFPNPPHPLPGGTVHQTFEDIFTSVVYVGGGSRLTPPALPMGGGPRLTPPAQPMDINQNSTTPRRQKTCPQDSCHQKGHNFGPIGPSESFFYIKIH